jgi:5-hydroxyisourate hydrolase-like protein (transthyretin family)
MKGKLSTHVLDAAGGRPAAGVSIDVWRCQEGKRRLLSRCWFRPGHISTYRGS